MSRYDQILTATNPSTPCVVVDLEIVREKLRALRTLFPNVLIYYAVKANPAPDVIAALAALGASFDLASAGEINRCVSLGIDPGRFCFGNTIKREVDIAWTHSFGVDLYAFDCLAELEKLARAAPGARVFCRLSVHASGAEWPLTRKFGCSVPMAAELLVHARSLGLRPVGVSFHVGSQQTDPGRWNVAIGHAARVFHACQRQGVPLHLLNLGGGLPAHYRAPVPTLERYAEEITTSVVRHFGASTPQLMIEPGRYLTGDAGILRSRVLLISRHGDQDPRRWVYLDSGRYNGLAETQGESIHYQIRTPRDGGPEEPVILAGPTCDSTDIIYDRSNVALPLDLAIGDVIEFLSAGAYTATYASVDFNGFPPIRTYCI
jgi:ornithine decarboxylase